MLSKFGYANSEMILQTIKQYWANRATIEPIHIIERPFDMFEIYVSIDDRHKILLSYDRSIIDIAIKVNGDYNWLTDLTDQKIIEGFESGKPENLIRNFNILDETLKKM